MVDRDLIRTACQSMLPENGSLYDFRFSGSRGNYRLSLFVDKVDSVNSFTTDELTEISYRIVAWLETQSLDESVSLEVSTPGLERELRSAHDFQRFAGKLVRLDFNTADDEGGKTGKSGGEFKILACDGSRIHLQKYVGRGNKKNPPKIELDYGDITYAKLFIDYI